MWSTVSFRKWEGESYRHVAQRFATNWTNVVSASVSLRKSTQQSFKHCTEFSFASWKAKTYYKLNKTEQVTKQSKRYQTWKHAECIKWPQGRPLTVALDVNRKSQHMGQFVSRPFSRHLWSANFIARQQLQVMQWKKSAPSPFPRRHKLQNGQW